MGQITEPVLWPEDWQNAVDKAISKLQEISPSYTQVMPSDPGVAIMEAGIYVLDLLGTALNRLPLASLVSWVNYLGVRKKGAIAAKATLTIQFARPLEEPWIMENGELFATDDGLLFATKSALEFAVGQSAPQFEVECTTPGTIGNVDENRITRMYHHIPNAIAVTNPAPATGGADSELDDEALERGRKIIRHLWRAVRAEDFEQIALAVPGVARAKLIESPGRADLYVLPQDGQSFEGEIRQKTWLAVDAVRIRAIPWQLHPAPVRSIDVTARVKLLSGYTVSAVRNRAETDLAGYLDPYSWEWGRRVPLGEIVHVLETVPGIDFTEELILPTENIHLTAYELAALGEVTLLDA